MIQLSSFVVCPETLGPLVEREAELWSPEAERAYPVREGLVFFGYPKRDAAVIAREMAEEHAWQGTPETVERDTEFLRRSAPAAVDFINLASRFVRDPASPPKALELGAGSGWVSWLLARAGYDTWMMDFEANSVAIGLQYQHPHLGEGRRFVGDARYAPFTGETFDLVLLKEFVHHVEDYDALFAEVSRVLRPGGIVALMEPTKDVMSMMVELRTPDPHEGHKMTWLDSYRRALRRNGFVIEHQTAIYGDRQHRRAAVAASRRRAARSVRDLASPDLFTQAHLRLLGGASNILISRRVDPAPRATRPPMCIVDPDTLVITADERARFSAMVPVLEEAAERLVPVASTTSVS